MSPRLLLASASHLAPTMENQKTDLDILLSAAFLDTFLLGLVGQQYYSYWTGGFNDRIYLKFFVNVQFALVTLQSVFIWNLAFNVLINISNTPGPPPSGPPPSGPPPPGGPPSGALWSGPGNSMCQLFIIIFANIFLATRIHGLTKSLVQSLTPMFFSTIAFVFGVVTIVASAWRPHTWSYKYAVSVVWYSSQATAECLISFFLVRALLKARSGIQRTDLMVKYLVRNVVQIAALATLWAIASLISWFWVKQILVYRIFDITSGSIYTHAIFDTLISRHQLRDRMTSASSAYVDLGPPRTQQSRSRLSGRFPSHMAVSNLSVAPQSNSEPGTTLVNKSDIIELGKVSEGKPPGVVYEF